MSFSNKTYRFKVYRQIYVFLAKHAEEYDKRYSFIRTYFSEELKPYGMQQVLTP